MKIRWIEIEADGEAVMAALRAFPTMLGRPQELPAAPVETVAMPQLPAAPAAPRKAKREVHPKAGKADEAQGQPTFKDTVLAALRESPKAYQQIAAYVKAHGYPNCTMRHLHSTISWCRKLGLARCNRHTNTWSLDGPAAKETAHA